MKIPPSHIIIFILYPCDPRLEANNQKVKKHDKNRYKTPNYHEGIINQLVKWKQVRHEGHGPKTPLSQLQEIIICHKLEIVEHQPLHLINFSKQSTQTRLSYVDQFLFASSGRGLTRGSSFFSVFNVISETQSFGAEIRSFVFFDAS